MSYQLPNATNTNFTSGLDQLFIYVATQNPSFFPLMLFAFYMVIWFGGVFSQKSQQGGGGDLPMWCFIAGFATSVLAITLFLIQGIINLTTVTLVLGVTFAGALWFFFSRDKIY